MLKSIHFPLLLLVVTLQLVSTSKILFLLPMASKSHLSVCQPLIRALSLNQGHNVTVVSPYPTKIDSVSEIISANFTSSSMAEFGDPFKRRSDGKLTSFFTRHKLVVEGCHAVFGNKNLLQFLLSEETVYDLIFINAYMNDCIFGLLAKHPHTPFIVVSTVQATADVTIHFGNRLPPSFVPGLPFDYPDSMTFVQRLINFCFNLSVNFINYLNRKDFEEIYSQYLGQELPDLVEIMGNARMLFMNSHFSLTYPRPTIPDVVEVGGMHCRPAKPLSKDLEEFVSTGNESFIFFSLGSTVQAKSMPESIRQIFLNVFSRLENIRVLWKWETGEMPDLPPNVRLVQWAPQQDILGHPRIKLFITHGGLLSTQEAAYHGVPLVGIPLFGDQILNMAKAERTGYALTLDLLRITEQSFERTIRRILTEKQYGERAKELSVIFRDQMETPLERAVFWSEYVMRYKNSSHMRSAARDLNFFQYHSLDVLTFILLIIIWSGWTVKLVIFAILRRLIIRKLGLRKQKVH